MIGINLASYASQINNSDAVSNLIDGAPTNLNTLNELALAINNDPHFSTTISNLLHAKHDTITVSLPLSFSPTNNLAVDLSACQPLLTQNDNLTLNI